jgi:DNA-binding XRE family transcriptional regulator
MIDLLRLACLMGVRQLRTLWAKYIRASGICQVPNLGFEDWPMPMFGEKLRTLRERRRLSLRQCAALLDIHAHSFISEIETGKKKPSLELVLKVADLFHVPLEQLARDELELDDELPDNRTESAS